MTFASNRRQSDANERLSNAAKRYVDTEALEEKLRAVNRPGGRHAEDLKGSKLDQALVPVRLIRASWLIKRVYTDRKELPHRKILEQTCPEAFVGDGELDDLLAEVHLAALRGTGVMSYPPIIVLSYPWRTPEHPDPTGSLLAMLAVQLEWYLSERAQLKLENVVSSHEVGIFIDFWSLYQRSENDWERAVFDMALNSMDAWYGHAGTVTLQLTKLPEDWGKVGEDRQHSGRGWCTFEKHVSSLAKVSTHVLDGGCFDKTLLVQQHPAAAGIGDGRFAQKSVRQLAMQATHEDRGDSPFLSSLINHGGPLHPERFPDVLATKGFTKEEDRARVVELYRAVAQGVLSTKSHTSFSHCRWAVDDFANCGYTLKLCVELAGMRMNNVGLDASCLRALLLDLTVDDLPALAELHVKDNPLGDDGLHELAAALRRGLLPELRYIVMRKNGETEAGRAALEEACNAREPPISINRAEKKNKEEELAHSKERKSAQRKNFMKLQARRGTVAWNVESHPRLTTAVEKVSMLTNNLRNFNFAAKGLSTRSLMASGRERPSGKFFLQRALVDRRSSNTSFVSRLSEPEQAPDPEAAPAQDEAERGGEAEGGFGSASQPLLQ